MAGSVGAEDGYCAGAASGMSWAVDQTRYASPGYEASVGNRSNDADGSVIFVSRDLQRSDSLYKAATRVNVNEALSRFCCLGGDYSSFEGEKEMP